MGSIVWKPQWSDGEGDRLVAGGRIPGHGDPGTEGSPTKGALVGGYGMEGEVDRGEQVQGGVRTMEESIRDILAREAAEAEAAADAREADDRPETGGQRARARAGEASQVYSVRIPVERLEQLRTLAEQRGVRPTALLREFVLERLDAEMAPFELVTLPDRDPDEVRLGPSRSAPSGTVIRLAERRA